MWTTKHTIKAGRPSVRDETGIARNFSELWIERRRIKHSIKATENQHEDGFLAWNQKKTKKKKNRKERACSNYCK